MSHGFIPQEVITQIRERADIVEVVSQYLSLTRAGQNLKGLCPFHQEKTPSFNVSPSRQIFHCFGCSEGGNVFTFLMKQEGMTFPDAVRELGSRFGVAVPAYESSASSADGQTRKRLEQVNESAAKWFSCTLSDPRAGRDAAAYLESRGIQKDTIGAFALGAARPEWDALLRSLSREGFTQAELALAGLVVLKDQSRRPVKEGAGYYDRFRARVMFPIRDLRKRVIGFGGRVVGEDTPKYLNSPETPLFNKGRALYGLEQARESTGSVGFLIVVEGYFDVITLHQAGITNVVATLGTALTPDHVRLMRRFVSHVVLLFDSDSAGVRAALRTLDLFVDSGIGVKVTSLPEGHDPDTFVRQEGPDAFMRLREPAPSLLDFAVEHSLQSAASGTIEDRIRSVDEVLRILQKTSNRIEKEECTRRVAERLGINQQRLIERYPELLPQRRPSRGKMPAEPALDPRFKGTPEERDLVSLLLQGQLTTSEVRALQVEPFTQPACRRIVEIALGSLDQDGVMPGQPMVDQVLSDPDSAPVATALIMLERHYDDVREYVRGCLATLERKHQATALSQLITSLRLAERDGRTEEADRLNVQINELRQRKAATPLGSAHCSPLSPSL